MISRRSSSYNVSNIKFEQYYKAQGIVPENEWTELLECLRTPLPLTFRLSVGELPSSRKRKLDELQSISRNIASAATTDTKATKRLKSLRWVPREQCWQLPLSCSQRSTLKTPSFSGLHDFLKREAGRSVTYQEAVSLIPALMLNINSDHVVLDMCAAPGSKTSAMLESALRSARLGGLDHQPRGALVANDLDAKRGHVLIHQCKRVGVNSLIVTHCPAEHYPRIAAFDRIMCDVPCSGDGTLRKEPLIWSKWSPKNALELHPLQIAIAKRGISLLKKGGYMAYSTCSLNPIENEAVVCEVLRSSNGAVKLVDMASTGARGKDGLARLSQLKRRPGMKHWSVFSPDMVRIDRSDDDTTMPRSIFPPSFEELKRFKVERCMRLCPTDQDTGGFFVAIFRKKRSTSCGGDDEDDDDEKAKHSHESKNCDKSHLRCFREKRAWRKAQEFYGIDASVDVYDRLFTRGSGRRCHLLSPGAAEILNHVVSSASRLSSTSRVVEYMGMCVLERCGTGPKNEGVGYRLTQEGIATLLPYMSESQRVVRVSASTLLKILDTLPSNLSSRQWSEIVKKKGDAARDSREFCHISVRSLPYDTRATLASESFVPGCFVFAPEESLSLDASFAVVAWLSGGSKNRISIEHAGWELQSRVDSIKSTLKSVLRESSDGASIARRTGFDSRKRRWA